MCSILIFHVLIWTTTSACEVVCRGDNHLLPLLQVQNQGKMHTKVRDQTLIYYWRSLIGEMAACNQNEAFYCAFLTPLNGDLLHGGKWRTCVSWKQTGARVTPGGPDLGHFHQQPSRQVRHASVFWRNMGAGAFSYSSFPKEGMEAFSLYVNVGHHAGQAAPLKLWVTTGSNTLAKVTQLGRGKARVCACHAPSFPTHSPT